MKKVIEIQAKHMSTNADYTVYAEIECNVVEGERINLDGDVFQSDKVQVSSDKELYIIKNGKKLNAASNAGLQAKMADGSIGIADNYIVLSLDIITQINQAAREIEEQVKNEAGIKQEPAKKEAAKEWDCNDKEETDGFASEEAYLIAMGQKRMSRIQAIINLGNAVKQAETQGIIFPWPKNSDTPINLKLFLDSFKSEGIYIPFKEYLPLTLTPEDEGNFMLGYYK